MKPAASPIMLTIAAGILAMPLAAAAYPGDDLNDYAALTVKQAKVIALNARPGAVTGKRLEKAPGGSGYRFAFDVKSKGTTYDVDVDANTGRILQNRKEQKKDRLEPRRGLFNDTPIE